MPSLEAEFDAAAGDKKVIRIPRLEISVRVPAKENLHTVLPGAIREQLRTKLRPLTDRYENEKSGSLAWRESTIERDAVDSLMHYLRRGTLPWHAAGTISHEIGFGGAGSRGSHDRMPADPVGEELGAISDAALQTSKQENISDLKPATQHLPVAGPPLDELLQYARVGSLTVGDAGSSPSSMSEQLRRVCIEQWPLLVERLSRRDETAEFFFRLLQLLPKDRNVEFIAAVSAQLPVQWRAAFSSLVAGVLNDAQWPLIPHRRLSLAATFLAEGLRAKDGEWPARLIEATTRLVSPADLLVMKEISSAIPAPAAELLGALNQEESGRSRLSVEQTKSDEKRRSDTDVKGRSGAEPGLTSLPETGSRSNAPQSLEEAALDSRTLLGVSFGGLTLLHPFVVSLFKNTGLLETGSTDLKPEVRPRAAAMLHFAATGQEDVYEWELGFIKILLGQLPSDPLPVAGGLLTHGDKEEIDAVLSSVIHHWSVLKNTTTDGLRVSFLQRRGFIREEDTGWHLQLERSSLDILLNRLPWSISVIKLPWMKKAIYTEWQALS